MQKLHYLKVWKNVCLYAQDHNVSLVIINNKKYFTWEIDNTKYALGNVKTPKPDGKYVYFNRGLDYLPKVYSFHNNKRLIKKHTEDILNEYFGLDKFNLIQVKENNYTLNRKTKKLSLGYRDSEIDIFQFLKNCIDNDGTKGIGENELICYFQDKLGFKEKYPFYAISTAKLEIIDKFLENKKLEVDKDLKYFNIIYNAYNRLYQKHLFSKEGEEALKYLNNRGINNEEIKNRGIGFGFYGDVFETNLAKVIREEIENSLTKDEIDNYQKWREKFEAYNPELYLGLLSENKTSRYDSMSNRITIPIRDKDNKIVAYGGRLFKESSSLSKYSLTKTSAMWQKSNNVFGYVDAKYNLTNSNSLLIVEGFMDAMALNKIGVPAVALMGVNCSSKQAELISSLNAEKIYVALDFDFAGQINNEKVRDALVKEGLDNVSIYIKSEWIDTKDFDEYINQEYKHFDFDIKKEIIEKSIGIRDEISFKSEGVKNELEIGE